MHQIRLFVMCDSQVVRSSLSVIFASQNNFLVIGHTGCSDESIAEAQNSQPDAIICRIDPREDGLARVRQIKEFCPYTKIFVFIDDDLVGESYIDIAVEVDGCMPKTMLPRDLVKAVELTCRTGVLCIPASLKCLIQGQKMISNGKDEQAPVDGAALTYHNEIIKAKTNNPLTAREMEIYGLITKNYSNKEIGKKLFISQPTVKSHVSSILRKLELNSRTQLLFYEIHNKLMNYCSEENNNQDMGVNGVV